MELERVRQFVEVMHTGSVNAAAKKLHVSQPALSRSLRRYEEELGCTLFDRTSNSLKPTPLAHDILGDAEDLVRAGQRLRDDIATAKIRSQMLRVGTCAPAPLWYLTSLLVSILPGTMFGQEMLGEDELERRLFDGTLDVAITNRMVAGMDCCLLMHENLYVSAPVEHPFAKRASLSFADLGSETFILYGGIGFWNEVHERLMPHAMFIRQDDREVFLQLMKTTHALGFASDAPGMSRFDDWQTQVTRVNIPLTDPEAHATFYLAAQPAKTEGNGAVATLFRRIGELSAD